MKNFYSTILTLGAVLGFSIPSSAVKFSSQDNTVYTDTNSVTTGVMSDDEAEESQWIYYGEATLMDGWVLPMLGYDQTQNMYKVPMQRNTENPNLYRLVNPYKYGPASDVNTHPTKEGYIEFDVTDPEHVRFNKVEAGFAYNDNFGLRCKEFYCANHLLNFQLRFPSIETETLINNYGMMMNFTTFEDGVVVLGSKSIGDVLEYDAHYGTEDNINCSAYWTEEIDYKDYPLDMTTKIFFPEEIADSPTPENPEKGEMEGVMTTQIDMNMGYGEELELLAAETFDVTASFNEKESELSIYNFKELEPITFRVDLETGKAVAEGRQLASVDDYEPSNVITYYYGNRNEEDWDVTARFYNLGVNKTLILVDPWGEAMDFFGNLFFNTAYYNTVVTLDGVIPGLEANAPSLSVVEEKVNYTCSHFEESDFEFATVNFKVVVNSDNLPEGSEVKLFYHGPNHVDDEYEEALVSESAEDTAGTYSFNFSLNYLPRSAGQQVTLYAESGPYRSETVTYTFDSSAVSAGIESFYTGNNEIKYFNLRGIELVEPTDGEIFIKVENGKATKVIK